MNHILVVDEDHDLQGLLTHLLRSLHYVPHTTGLSFMMEEVHKNKHDAIIVEVAVRNNTPGIPLIKHIREIGDTRPIVVLTKERSSQIELHCYEAGADVVLHKPHGTTCLKPVLKRLIKRPGSTTAKHLIDGIHMPDQEFKFFGGRITPKLLLLEFKTGAQHKLSPKEVGLFFYLHQHAGSIVKKNDIIETLWPSSSSKQSRSINTIITKIRRLYRENGIDLNSKIKAASKVGWRIIHPNGK